MNIKKLVAIGLTLQIIVGAFQIMLFLKTRNSEFPEHKLIANSVNTKSKDKLTLKNKKDITQEPKGQEIPKSEKNLAALKEKITHQKNIFLLSNNLPQKKEKGKPSQDNKPINTLSEEENSKIKDLFTQMYTHQISPVIFSEEFALLKASLPIKKHGLLMVEYSKAINNGLVEDSYFIH